MAAQNSSINAGGQFDHVTTSPHSADAARNVTTGNNTYVFAETPKSAPTPQTESTTTTTAQRQLPPLPQLPPVGQSSSRQRGGKTSEKVKKMTTAVSVAISTQAKKIRERAPTALHNINTSVTQLPKKLQLKRKGRNDTTTA